MMLQRHPLADRGNDLYETPPEATHALMRVENLPHRVWEPAAGRGAIVDVLRAAGHEVLGSDLIDYGRPDFFGGRDFLLETKAPPGTGAIVMNPPYRDAAAFVAHAVALCPLVFALLRLTFIEAGTGRQRKHQLRRRVLDEVPPARIHVFSRRLPALHRDGWAGPRASNPTAFGWFTWVRDHVGPTRIDRVDWKDLKSFAAIGAGGGPDASAPAKVEMKMDMTQYRGSAFLKVADITKAGGAVRVVIGHVQLGQYAKPDLALTDGSKLSLNVTNTKILCQTYGTESAEWIGKEVELHVGTVDFKGAPTETILVKPVSPAIAKKPPKRKKLSDDMGGDEIDF